MTGSAMSVHLAIGDDAIATLNLERPGDGPNRVDDAFLAALADAVDELAGRSGLRGVVVTSAQPDFLVGADIDAIYALHEPADALALARRFTALLRRLETLGTPVVAAVDGRALGGGLELALACHHRIATDRPATRLGLPEMRLGLMPGGGGTQRLPRLIGVRPALELMLDGTELDARSAHGRGIVDALAADGDELAGRARAWIEARPEPRQPWDREGFAWPGGGPDGREMRRTWSLAPALLRRRRVVALSTGVDLLSAVFEGSQVDLDTGCWIESRYFAHCVTGRPAKNALRVLWYQLAAVRRGEARPAGHDERRFETLGVLGAGLMGAGIANVAARAGLSVRIKDVDRAHAERALDHARRQWDRDLERGRGTAEARDAALARMQAIESDAELAGCDLVIEAVDEDRSLKERVLAAAGAAVDPGTIVASNTSTLPIGSLAPACEHRGRFLGLHFFSPVERMPLLEIIRGPETGEATLAQAFDFARQIGKTAIAVNDGRGFFTSRVFAAYVLEGAALLGEGQPPALIEHAATAAGMPLGPLALTDEVSLTLIAHILDQERRDEEAAGRNPAAHPGEAVVRALIERHGRPGRRGSGGFYDYPEEGGRRLWPGLAEAFPRAGSPAPSGALAERLMLVQANEAARAYAEGIVERLADANVASVLGWGFPATAGGVLGYIDELGAAAFVERTRALAARHGERFAPADILVRTAEAGGTIG